MLSALNFSSAAAHSSSISSASRMNPRSALGSHVRGCRSLLITFLCTVPSNWSSGTYPPLASVLGVIIPAPAAHLHHPRRRRHLRVEPPDAFALRLKLIDRELPHEASESARVPVRPGRDDHRAVVQPHVRRRRRPRRRRLLPPRGAPGRGRRVLLPAPLRLRGESMSTCAAFASATAACASALDSFVELGCRCYCPAPVRAPGRR